MIDLAKVASRLRSMVEEHTAEGIAYNLDPVSVNCERRWIHISELRQMNTEQLLLVTIANLNSDVDVYCLYRQQPCKRVL